MLKLDQRFSNSEARPPQGTRDVTLEKAHMTPGKRYT